APRNDGKTLAASACLALARRRPVGFFGRTMRCSSRRRTSLPLCGAPAFQALLERIHQADHIVPPFLRFGGLDRLAGGLALDQRLQRILVLVLVFRQIEMPGLAVEDVAGEFNHVFRNFWILDAVEIFT